MMRRHVLRNALVPTVAVIAVQIGYLFGGIIAVEKIFNYNGMGATMLFAAQRKDIPMLTAGVHRHRHRLHAGDAGGRPDHRLDEPADPAGRGTLMVDVIVNPRPTARRWPRRPRLGAVPGPPRDAAGSWSGGRRSSSATSSSSAGSSAPSSASGSRRTTRSTTSPPATCRRAPEHWFGHGPARPRRAVAGDGRLARRPDRRPAGGAPRRAAGTLLGPGHGLLPRAASTTSWAGSSRPSWPCR